MNPLIPSVLSMLAYLAIPAVVAAEEQSLTVLKRKADQVLSESDNVVRRAGIDPVFRYAERCLAAGRTNESVKYYSNALEHQPWNLKAQLAFAHLLNATGDTEGSRQRAELVWEYAENDSLLAEAARLQKQPFTAELEQIK